MDEAERQALVVVVMDIPSIDELASDSWTRFYKYPGKLVPVFESTMALMLPHRLQVCLTRMFPPNAIHLKESSGGPAIGWVCHIAPKEMLLSAIDVQMTAEES